MLVSVLQTVMGGALLYLGGEALVAGASRLARGLGVSALGVGLTVVAFGTSSPELFVTLSAAYDGLDDLAIGNVVGSNICNIALILGLSAVIHPLDVHARLIKLDLPVLILVTFWLLYALGDLGIGRIEGAICTAALIAYTGFNLWEARREQADVQQELAAVAPADQHGPARNILYIAVGLVVLVVGSGQFVDGAVGIAEWFELSPAFIGLTIVAVGTSLPELAVSVLASARGQSDIAVGNVVGSNIFNILAVLGVAAMVHPLYRGGLIWGDFIVMVAVTLLMTPLLYFGPKISRFEGLLLLTAYVGYIAWRLSLS